MAVTGKSRRVCPNGHVYYKSSNCPVCPVCEDERKPEEGFLTLLSAPARRALERAGITSLSKLAQYTEADILKFHGMGPASLPKLRNALEAEGRSFVKSIK